MPAPTSVVINPGVKLLNGVAPTSGGLNYTNPTATGGASVRTRVTSITLCDTGRTGVQATITLGGAVLMKDYPLPADGSPFTLVLNESLDGTETLSVTALTGAVVAVRATGEEIWTT